MNDIKIYRFGSRDFVAAESEEQAIKFYLDYTDTSPSDFEETVVELDHETMTRLKYCDENEGVIDPVPFTDRLQFLIMNCEEFPCMFASTEG